MAPDGQPPSSEVFIGIMSGTSLDGVDAALVDFSHATPTLIDSISLPLPEPLRLALLALNQPGPNELHRSHQAAFDLATLYAHACRPLQAAAQAHGLTLTAIGAHGQTVRHHPPGVMVSDHSAHAHPYTTQLNHPSRLAELTGLPVVADFRSRDIAAGGQGAPLVPAFHRAVFATPGQSMAMINIGGMANFTAVLANGDVLGADSGPGNVLMDSWIQRHLGRPYDESGAWAASGQVQQGLLTQLMAHPYFAQPGPKSTGRDLFNLAWLDHQLAAQPQLPSADVQATLCAFTAHSIADALHEVTWDATPATLWLCGGGAHNKTLRRQLESACANHGWHTQARPTDDLGWPVQWIEAAAFAWLARQCWLGMPGNVPAVTGAAGHRVLGAIYPA